MNNQPLQAGQKLPREVSIWIKPDGRLVISDLSKELLPVIEGFGQSVDTGSSSKPLTSRFYRSKNTYASIDKKALVDMPYDELWNIHNSSGWLQDVGTAHNKASLLDIKIELCRRLLERCSLCERRCGVNRVAGEAGWCGVRTSNFSREFLHYGEEKELIPSHTIFFTGCNMRCKFCHEYKFIEDPESGHVYRPQNIAYSSQQRVSEGVCNVNFVGGEPTVHLLEILETLNQPEMPDIPVVWNSNMYMSKEAMKLLDGIVDIYLGDMKFGNDACAEELSDTVPYRAVIERNFEQAERQGADIIVRHLPLPGHWDCCTRPVLEWVAGETQDKAISLLTFMPNGSLNCEPKKRLPQSEYDRVVSYALELGLRIC